MSASFALGSGHATLVGRGGPPHCNSGIIGLTEHLNVILLIPHSHYYRVGGPPKALVVLGTLVVGDNQELSPGPSRVFRLLVP